ncbi:MAG: FAD-dependent oxidoreductase [Puia sp.]|nr:FAD-dependent oxidoreductase [Puia sp.]
MPHSPLTGFLQRAFSEAVRQDTGLAASLEARRRSRREFLRNAVYVAGGLAVAPGMLQAWPPGGPTGSKKEGRKVAIIGAGIAGLNACYQLKKQGIHATVYEAAARVGGRMYTLKDRFGAGITTDIGGEFVDTTHTDIHQLVKELNLPLYDLREDRLIPKTFYFGGKQLGQQDLKTAITPFVGRLVADIRSLPEKISHETAGSFRSLDHQSITEYLSGIGIGGWLYDFLNVVLTREYGMEASEQSAVNFLIMFEAPPAAATDYELFGNDHEVFKIQGGSQQLTDALYRQISDRVVMNHKLVAIDSHAAGGYRISLEQGGSVRNLDVDYLLLTLPFTILRTLKFSVDMPDEKRKCIDEIGYGNSCKFVMGMDSKPWRTAGKQGYTFTDISFGCGWDSSQRQSEGRGSFTVFGGGDFGDSLYQRKTEELVKDFIPALDKIYPGAGKAWNGRQVKFCWAKNPFSAAAYSSFKKGQWSTLAGWEAVPVGNIYFAGEHVSRDFQGYMNGGAQTAREAAALIAAKIGEPAK